MLGSHSAMVTAVAAMTDLFTSAMGVHLMALITIKP